MPLSIGRAPVPCCGRAAAPRPSERPGWTAPGRALPLGRPVLPGRWASGSLVGQEGRRPPRPPPLEPLFPPPPPRGSVGWGSECHVLWDRRMVANAVLIWFQRGVSGGLALSLGSHLQSEGLPGLCSLGKGGGCRARNAPSPAGVWRDRRLRRRPPPSSWHRISRPAGRVRAALAGIVAPAGSLAGTPEFFSQEDKGNQQNRACLYLSVRICQSGGAWMKICSRRSPGSSPPLLEMEDPSPQPSRGAGIYFFLKTWEWKSQKERAKDDLDIRGRGISKNHLYMEEN